MWNGLVMLIFSAAFDSFQILEHLVGLNSPWNCPHGRPTMRHLVDLTTLRQFDEDNDVKDFWTA